MGIKLDTDGHAELRDGHPVYEIDGVDKQMNVEQLLADLKTASDQRDAAAERATVAEGRLTKFKGLEPDKAREALALAATLDGKDVGDLQRNLAKVQADKEGLEITVGELTKTGEGLTSRLHSVTVGAAIREFAQGSMSEAFKADPQRAVDLYGRHFLPSDNGGVVGYSDPAHSVALMTGAKHATVPEAMLLLIGDDKTMLAPKKASGTGGGDAAGDTGSGGGGAGKATKPPENETRKEQAERYRRDLPAASS